MKIAHDEMRLLDKKIEKIIIIHPIKYLFQVFFTRISPFKIIKIMRIKEVKEK